MTSETFVPVVVFTAEEVQRAFLGGIIVGLIVGALALALALSLTR